MMGWVHLYRRAVLFPIRTSLPRDQMMPVHAISLELRKRSALRRPSTFEAPYTISDGQGGTATATVNVTLEKETQPMCGGVPC